MYLLSFVIKFYAIVTAAAIITSIARFLATSKAERDAKNALLKKLLEKAEQSGTNLGGNSILLKFMNLKVNGIKENNPIKIFIFNAIMHFVPIFHIGIFVANIGDVIVTFKRKKV